MSQLQNSELVEERRKKQSLMTQFEDIPIKDFHRQIKQMEDPSEAPPVQPGPDAESEDVSGKTLTVRA